MFYEKNERVFQLKSGETAPILWSIGNDGTYIEYDADIIKLKVKSEDENLSDNGINLTDYFYYIPKTNEVFFGVWYSHWNEYAKQDGTNFVVTASNKDGENFEGKYGISPTGTFDIFEYHTFMQVENVSDIKQLTLHFHPIVETLEGSEFGEEIMSEINLEMHKTGTKDDVSH